jgi:hypothetical protein
LEELIAGEPNVWGTMLPGERARPVKLCAYRTEVIVERDSCKMLGVDASA